MAGTSYERHSDVEKIHAEEFVLTYMTGMKQPQEEYFRCVRDGELNYFSEMTENIFVEVNDETGKLVGQSRVEAAVFGGRKKYLATATCFRCGKTRRQMDFNSRQSVDLLRW